MKKIFLLMAFICLSTSSLHASLNDGKSWSEEAACFKLLNQAVANDIRFKDPVILEKGDLSKVLFDEANNSFYDFSTYENFWNASVRNPANAWGSGWDDYIFEARRNNIWTIISWNNYVYSQISWFWKDSNFDFPLESKTGKPFGDKYRLNWNFFKEYVIYTHHLRSSTEDFPLMSCWIAKVIPLWWRTFSDINESWYMTNILNGIAPQANLWWKKCASWFEWSYDSQDWEDFYKMKANVCVQSYDESDYLKLEVISIAFDNDSKRINEYYTHPLQVRAMRNNATHAQWLAGIQKVFRDLLESETCYWVVHGNRSNLPSSCGNNFGPISYNRSHFSFLDYIFPKAYADRPTQIEIPVLTPEEEEDTGMMVQWNLPFKLNKKLEAVPDESFREYMLLSILPNFEELIQYRQDNDVLLTPFEEVFLSCNLDYTQRLWVVTDFLENLNVESFSLSKLDYSDETYWDCIIPYPDKDKIDIVVAWSFESNQLLAQKLNGSFAPSPDSPEVAEYIRKREALLVWLNRELELIDSRFNSWEIDSNTANILKRDIEEETSIAIESIDFWSWEFSESQNEIIENTLGSSDENSTNIMIYVIIAVLMTLWVSSVGFAFYKKNKNK